MAPCFCGAPTHRNKVCYGKELRANGKLQGTVTAQVTIDSYLLRLLTAESIGAVFER